MKEIEFKNLTWQRIRLALSLALMKGEPVVLRNANSFIEKNFDYHPFYETIKRFMLETGCGMLADSGDDLQFMPEGVRYGEYLVDTGKFTPLSEIELLLMPTLFNQEFRSVLHYSGVTHSHLSYPTVFLKEGLFALLEKMGFYASMNLKRFGFYGSGGGSAESRIYPAEIKPCEDILSFGERRIEGARVFMAGMNMDMAKKEKEFLMRSLKLEDNKVQIMEVVDADGMGNSIQVYVECGGMHIIISRDMAIYNSAGDIVFDEAKYYSSISALVTETERFVNTDYIPVEIISELVPYIIMSGLAVPEKIKDMEEFRVCTELI
jgi:hypothetical protein